MIKLKGTRLKLKDLLLPEFFSSKIAGEFYARLLSGERELSVIKADKYTLYMSIEEPLVVLRLEEPVEVVATDTIQNFTEKVRRIIYNLDDILAFPIRVKSPEVYILNKALKREEKELLALHLLNSLRGEKEIALRVSTRKRLIRHQRGEAVDTKEEGQLSEIIILHNLALAKGLLER